MDTVNEFVNLCAGSLLLAWFIMLLVAHLVSVAGVAIGEDE
jgi:hypothetical protein